MIMFETDVSCAKQAREACDVLLVLQPSALDHKRVAELTDCVRHFDEAAARIGDNEALVLWKNDDDCGDCLLDIFRFRENDSLVKSAAKR